MKKLENTPKNINTVIGIGAGVGILAGAIIAAKSKDLETIGSKLIFVGLMLGAGVALGVVTLLFIMEEPKK